MPTVTLQPDAAGLADAYIRSGALATSNFGTGNLLVGETNVDTTTARVLIKFDLSSIPDNAVLTSVVLSLYCDADLATNARTYRVYRLKRNWVEGTQFNVLNTTGCSWNEYSIGNSWQTAGGFGANDCEQTAIGSRAFSATETLNQFKDFTLTATSKAELDLGFGWMVKADTESNDAYGFASSDNATAANRPKLTITYEVPVPTPASGIAGTAGPTVAISATLTPSPADAVAVSVVESIAIAAVVEPSPATAVSAGDVEIAFSATLSPNEADAGSSTDVTAVKGSVSAQASPAGASSDGSVTVILGSIAIEAVASAVGETVNDPLQGGQQAEPDPAEAVGETTGIAVKGSILVIPVPIYALGVTTGEAVKGSVLISPAILMAVGETTRGNIYAGAPELEPEPASAVGGTFGPTVLIPGISSALQDKVFKGMARAKFKGMR